MNPQKQKYAVGLTVTLVLLFGSVGVVAAEHHAGGMFLNWHDRDWRQGLDDQRPGPGGMMGGRGWDQGNSGDEGASAITPEQAQGLAQAWVDANLPGATLDGAWQMMMGYRFTVTKNGQVVAVIMVNDDTGQLVVRQLAVPTPAASS